MVKHVYSTRAINHSQRGVVLIVGLIMVLLISIVALASIRGSGLQEAMAGNIRDRGLAFQASEAALSLGESRVDYLHAAAPVCNGTPHNSLTCFTNLDATPAGSAQYLNDAGFTSKGNVTAMSLMTGMNVSQEPIFVLEELASFTPDDGGALDESAAKNITALTSYRVTSKGVGLTADSQVITQSTYNRSAH